jgi:N utilization substance protein A
MTSGIKITSTEMRYIALFENITNVPVRDCFIDNGVIYYIVEEGKIGLAIGSSYFASSRCCWLVFHRSV